MWSETKAPGISSPAALGNSARTASVPVAGSMRLSEKASTPTSSSRLPFGRSTWIGSSIGVVEGFAPSARRASIRLAICRSLTENVT
jgi:hypothetical protein